MINNQRVPYFDVLNIIACIAVIALHHNGIVHWYDVHSVIWIQALVFEVFFFWAVPIFFMLTGATLLGYRAKYSTYDFFKKRDTRTLIPFILFSMLYIIHNYFIFNISYDSGLQAINDIFNTRIAYANVFWFFIPLLMLYLVIPVLSLLKDNIKILLYIVFLGFLFSSCIPVLFPFLGLEVNRHLQFSLGGYILFLVLGYLAHILYLPKKVRLVIYLLGILGALFRFFMTYKMSLDSNSINYTFTDYIQFHSVFLALSVFVFFKYLKLDFLNKNTPTLGKISSCSLGIYLIHILVMEYELKLYNIKPDNILWRTVGILSTYVICLFIVYSIKRIPYIKNIFP